MRFKNQELLTSAILYLFPWTGSLFGGWYLVEGILPSHRYEIPAAVLTLLWAYGAYPLYCRIAARNGLDPVRMTALYICPGVLGVMMASVWLFARLPFLNALFSVLPPFLSLIFCITLVCPSGPVRQPPDRVPKGLTPLSENISASLSAAIFLQNKKPLVSGFSLPLSFFAPHPQSFAPIHTVRRVKTAHHRVPGLRRDGQHRRQNPQAQPHIPHHRPRPHSLAPV